MLKNIAGVFCLAVMVLSVSCASVEQDDKAGAHYKMGVVHLQENRVQMAYVEFHKAYELKPDDKNVLNALGIIHLMHLDEPRKSMEYFEKAIKVDPNYSEAYNNLGYAYERAGEFDKAILHYQKALSNPLYPTAEKGYINMGNAYYRTGRYENAVNAYKEALKRSPNLSLAYLKLALCYNAMGKYGDASTAITHAIKLDTTYKGNREKFIEDLNIKKISAKGQDEKDVRDYLEILKY